MVEIRSSQIRKAREKNIAEPRNNRENRRPPDPPIGPQNWPNHEEENRNQKGVFMIPDEISDLVKRAVQRAMEKRPIQEPSRDVSYPEVARERPRERIPREGQGSTLRREHRG